MHSLKNDTDDFEPTPGAYGLPARSRLAYQAFLASAKAEGSPLTEGRPVPAPQFLCDASKGGINTFVASSAVAAALGKPWFGSTPQSG